MFPVFPYLNIQSNADLITTYFKGHSLKSLWLHTLIPILGKGLKSRQYITDLPLLDGHIIPGRIRHFDLVPAEIFSARQSHPGQHTRLQSGPAEVVPSLTIQKAKSCCHCENWLVGGEG